MRRLGRWLTLFALAAACGCSWAKRPYAHDPLLAGGRGTWGNPAERLAPDTDEPSPPPALPAARVTSP